LGIEGPQAALLVVTVLMGIWALVPWLDRRASRERPSPAFTDLGVAALLFIGFLTLKAWDIGGGSSAQPDVRAVARVCTIWILIAGFLASLLRFALYRQTWFVFTGAALLHAALHGFAGMSYLAAGAIAALAATAGLLVNRDRPALAGEPP
jgi:quinol-cytochrome oxidoreductase complex cytochrome b subunit